MSHLWDVIEAEMDYLRMTVENLRVDLDAMREERDGFESDYMNLAKKYNHDGPMRGKSAR